MRTLTFGELYDMYQQIMYDREVFVDALAEIIAERNAERILDCAAGTGLPSIDLAKRGMTVDCTDGSAEMLEQLRANAAVAGVVVDAEVRDWCDLGNGYANYDYVMCRGNSLVYAATWVGSGQPASLGRLIDSLVAITRTAKIGGTVHFDFPRRIESAHAAYPVRVVDGHDVSAAESVYVHDGCRVWSLRMDVDGYVHELTMTSSVVDPAMFRSIAELAGLTDLQSVVIAGERPAYEVLLGTRAA